MDSRSRSRSPARRMSSPSCSLSPRRRGPRTPPSPSPVRDRRVANEGKGFRRAPADGGKGKGHVGKQPYKGKGKGKEMKGKAKGNKGMAKTDGKNIVVDDAASDSENVRRRRTRRGYHTGNPDVGGGARDDIEVPAALTQFLQVASTLARAHN
eukprot:6492536-Amphidinium_carterae.1